MKTSSCCFKLLRSMTSRCFSKRELLWPIWHDNMKQCLHLDCHPHILVSCSNCVQQLLHPAVSWLDAGKKFKVFRVHQPLCVGSWECLHCPGQCWSSYNMLQAFQRGKPLPKQFDGDIAICLRDSEHHITQEGNLQAQEVGLARALPRLLILVTGKGPQKQMYLDRMQGLDLRWVAFRTLWLEPKDYPLLLGCCDAGVSLHTSSSGLDLPMKVRCIPPKLLFRF